MKTKYFSSIIPLFIKSLEGKKKHDYVIRRKHSNFNKKVTLGHQTSENTIEFDKITLNTGHKIYTLQFY
jgi:hypothetical protein